MVNRPSMKKRTRERGRVGDCKDISVSRFYISGCSRTVLRPAMRRSTCQQLSFCPHGIEMPLHTLDIRADTGEQPKSFRRLKYGHAAAIHGPTTARPSHAQQLRFERKIYDFR